MKCSYKAVMLACGAAVISVFVAVPVLAQQAANSTRVLDEIVVTAQKREESLQDVPISITAVSGETLENNGVIGFQALGERSPNLRVQVADGGPANLIGIRGITSGFNRGFEQSVGVVVDGVYSARGEFFRTGLLDVERVEVLRGPQGTLFGKNATAGLINVVTAAPTDELEFSLRTRAGTDELRGATAVISGPITDRLRARFAYQHFYQDAYFENTGGGVDGGATESNNLRLKIEAEPTDNLTIGLTYERMQKNVNGSSQQLLLIDSGPNVGFFGFNPAANPYDPGNGGAGFIPLFGVSSSEYFPAFDSSVETIVDDIQSSNLDAFFDTTSDNVRLRADWTLGDYTVTYVGGLIDLTDQNQFDPDFSANPYLIGPANVESEQVTHELRIQSQASDRFNWTAGLYKFDADTTNNTPAFVFVPNVFPFPAGPVAPGVPPLPNPDYQSYVNGVGRFGIRETGFEQEADAWAIFAQGTFEVTDNFRITVGGRYTDETKTSDQFITSRSGTLRTPAGDLGVTPIVVGGVLNPNPTPAEYANSFDSTVVPYCLSNKPEPQYDAAGLGAPCGPGLRRTESDFTPMINFQYDFSDEVNGYFSYSEGFKGGGFNGQARRQASLEFEEETVDAFEIGLKSVLLDGAMTANVAVYSSNYDNFQTTQFVNQVFIVGNAAEVEARGIEFDLLWQATDNLRLGLSGAISNTEYKDFTTAACTSNQLMALSPFAPPPNPSPRSLCAQDVSGQGVEQAPDFSGNLLISYDIPLDGMPFDAQISTDINFSDEYLLTQDLDPLLHQDAYSTVNLRFALNDKDERWQLALLGRNITDETYVITAAGVPAQNGAYFASSNRGSIYELNFNINF
ncbi:MAG: TonB-dependent receptor [Pseudomonadota bacterium]